MTVFVKNDLVTVDDENGIAVASEEDIFKYFLDNYANTFPSAKSLKSPSYALALINSHGASVVLQAMQACLNFCNFNTASGTMLSILGQNILNVKRIEESLSSQIIAITVDGLSNKITVPLTIGAGVSKVIPKYQGITITGYSGVVYQTTSIWPLDNSDGTGDYTVNVAFYKVKDTTSIDLDSATTLSPPISGVTSGGVASFRAGTATSVTVPAGTIFSESATPPAEPYYLQEAVTYTLDADYFVTAYSSDGYTVIPEATILNIIPEIPNLSAFTAYPNLLGSQQRESDLDYKQRIHNYSAVSGSTINGFNIAMSSLKIPQLSSYFIIDMIDVPNEGDRGVKVLINYPTINPTDPSSGYDVTDPNLIKIAQKVVDYLGSGIQSYATETDIGATKFTVSIYSNITKDVYLVPIATDSSITVTMDFIYNNTPADSGFSGGVFDMALLTPDPVTGNIPLNNIILASCNAYFASKKTAGDMLYSVSELSTILIPRFQGLIDLRNFKFNGNTTYFRRNSTTFATPVLVYSNLTVNAIVKEDE